MQPARAWHRSQHSCCVDACTRGQSTPSFQSKPALNVHFAGGGGTGCFGLSAVQEAPLPVVSDRNASPATVQSPNHFCRELQHGPTRRSSARGGRGRLAVGLRTWVVGESWNSGRSSDGDAQGAQQSTLPQPQLVHRRRQRPQHQVPERSLATFYMTL